MKGSFINPEILLAAALIFILAIIAIVIAIYSSLRLKKKRHLYLAGVQDRLQEWISESIFYESGGEPPSNRGLQHIVGNPSGRQMVIDEILNSKKNLTGQAAQNIVALYGQLGLKAVSLLKLSSRHWHEQARGIQELYLMEQADSLKKIYRFVNNKNELVRAEAQVGILHLTGFEGLRFLDMLSYPISEWQQLKLLDQLRRSGIAGSLQDSIPKWLRSKNDSVVQFSLKLVDEYQQLGLHDAVILCLRHGQPAVRRQAISTLLRIANERTPSVLADHYPHETLVNRSAILSALQKIGTADQVPMLAISLKDENDSIKLASAKALIAGSQEGLALLGEFAAREPMPYETIYRHAKWGAV